MEATNGHVGGFVGNVSVDAYPKANDGLGYPLLRLENG